MLNILSSLRNGKYLVDRGADVRQHDLCASLVLARLSSLIKCPRAALDRNSTFSKSRSTDFSLSDLDQRQ